MELYLIIFVLFMIGSYLRLSFRQRDTETDCPIYKRPSTSFKDLFPQSELNTSTRVHSPFEERLKEAEHTESIPETIWPESTYTYSNQFMSAADKRTYLKSAEWKLLRIAVIERDKHCQACGSRGTQVHHLRYDNLGNETLSDLVLLCDICHQQQHNHYGYDRVTEYSPLILK